MLKYIFQNDIIDFGRDISTTTKVGTTWDDRFNYPVPLSADQIDFFESNPSASPYEIWNMQISESTIIVESPSEIREIIYNTIPLIEWGGFIITCDKARDKLSVYLHSKQTDKYNELNSLWEAARMKIQTKNPD